MTGWMGSAGSQRRQRHDIYDPMCDDRSDQADLAKYRPQNQRREKDRNAYTAFMRFIVRKEPV